MKEDAHSPAGWYPDPWDEAFLRYWDGDRWTDHVSRPVTLPPPTGFPPPNGQPAALASAAGSIDGVAPLTTPAMPSGWPDGASAASTPRWYFAPLLSDERAYTLVSRQRERRLINRESVEGVYQTWLVLHVLRYDYTTPVGRRGVLQHQSASVYVNAITGEPFYARTAGPAPERVTGPLPHLPVVCTAAAITADTQTLWSRYCRFMEPGERQRTAEDLQARGVPMQLAKTLHVTAGASVLRPVFIGLLALGRGRRAVVIDGLTGDIKAELTRALTASDAWTSSQLTGGKARKIIRVRETAEAQPWGPPG
jgi:Protein of unknown function (DUF2510)